MELLSPAGSPESLCGGVQAGADAVYLGFGPLNARRNAKNFTREELEESIKYCHLRGVRVYLTLNTLLTDRELPLAAETAAMASALGVDGVIVQDLGVARILRETVPDVPIHASTQMTVHSLGGVLACRDLGMSRVVLARELPRAAIAELCRESPIEIEVFGHGALCMCYSGQCYLSSVLGGRSGNRGLCAQPCRLAFRWQGENKPTRPLSLKDLSLAKEVQELDEMGVACLKLEGRMKRAEYVSVVTGIYADLLREQRGPREEEQKKLTVAFSRSGFTRGYYEDRKGPEMFGMRSENTKEPEKLFAEAKQHYAHGEHRQIPITMSAVCRLGMPISLTIADEKGNRVVVEGVTPEMALRKEITEETLRQQLTRTGGTVYRVGDFSAEVEKGCSLPLSALNALRREALSRLDRLRTDPPKRRCYPYVPMRKQEKKGEPAFILSFRRFLQLAPESLEQTPAMVYLPSHEIAVHQREMRTVIHTCPTIKFGVTLPRVAMDRELPKLKEELGIAKSIGVTEAHTGNLGQLALVKELGFVPRGDFGLGIMNSLSMEELARLGFASATVSFELRLAQVRDISKPIETEMIVYGRLPLMLTENCILKNRGRGCHCGEGAQMLEDRKGEVFPVEGAWGCRSEIFNAKVLWLADKKSDWQKAGLSYVRLSFLEESAQECAQVLAAYRTGKGERPKEFTRGLYYRGVE